MKSLQQEYEGEKLFVLSWEALQMTVLSSQAWAIYSLGQEWKV